MEYEPLQKAVRKRRGCSYSWAHWWQELLSIMFSFGCLVAAIVILCVMQDKPTGDWTFYFSLNSTIASVITAAKASAMFVIGACLAQWKWVYFHQKTRGLVDLDIIEEASRVPLGSVKMMASIPWSIATLGAVTIVLGLGIDSAAQQVLSTDLQTRWINDSSATFGLAENYFSGAAHSLVTQGGYRMFDPPDPYTEDTSMQGAIFRPFYNLESPAPFECPTNCTWHQDYVSLGFSTACHDVTEETWASQNCSEVDSDSAPLNCTMTTPGGVRFSTLEMLTDWSTVLLVQAKSLYTFDLLSTPAYVSPNFIRLAVFRQPSFYSGIHPSPNQTSECDISFAAYKYSNAFSRSNQFSVGSTEILPLDSANMSDPSRWNEDYVTFTASGLSEFKVSMADIGGLLSSFTSPLISGMLLAGESVPTVSAGITPTLGNPSATNTTAIFENMASSMTDELRSRYNATAYGLTATTVVLVRVQWFWLALPLFVVLTSAVVLVAGMVDSRGATGVAVWKAKSTALLFHSVGPLFGTFTTEVRGPEQLEELVKATRVKLT